VIERCHLPVAFVPLIEGKTAADGS